MKKLFAILIAFIGLQTSQAQLSSGEAALNKCPGGRCQSDCFFTDCFSCCPDGTRAECNCFIEFARCYCKINVMAYDAVVTVHYDRLLSFTNWLKTTGNRLYTPFLNLQGSLLAARTKEVSTTDFQVAADKYASAMTTFEKAVGGFSGTVDYQKAQTEISARKAVR